MAETTKARSRRLAENWFERFAPDHRSGIDIGCQHDFLNATFRRWDAIYGDGDATFMLGVPDGVFHTVYASHVLEHLADPVTAVVHWWRILRPGGHLVIVVPHRDLYERRTILPSRWNADHKSFWLPDTDEPPHTNSLRRVVEQAIPGADIVDLRVQDAGWQKPASDAAHSGGEYSIEIVVRKPA